ncbi:hypothetical protein T10_1236 [Trichinella papuae]|uniref:Uncharacterized protein n=1 Tax=Trichinella papuae TaxID=268474 RepID=A0A0V1MI07_9BILA|nr:hypothetical protein T10_1236 [Trichinella papuae]
MDTAYSWTKSIISHTLHSIRPQSLSLSLSLSFFSVRMGKAMEAEQNKNQKKKIHDRRSNGTVFGSRLSRNMDANLKTNKQTQPVCPILGSERYKSINKKISNAVDALGRQTTQQSEQDKPISNERALFIVCMHAGLLALFSVGHFDMETYQSVSLDAHRKLGRRSSLKSQPLVERMRAERKDDE